MPATEDVQVFGKAGDRGVQVPLPFDLPQRKSFAPSRSTLVSRAVVVSHACIQSDLIHWNHD